MGKEVVYGTKDGPRASTEDGDGVAATSGDLTGIDIEDEDGINDGRLSRGGNSLTPYIFFFVVLLFPLES